MSVPLTSGNKGRGLHQSQNVTRRDGVALVGQHSPPTKFNMMDYVFLQTTFRAS